jgi:hypothetical protein
MIDGDVRVDMLDRIANIAGEGGDATEARRLLPMRAMRRMVPRPVAFSICLLPAPLCILAAPDFGRGRPELTLMAYECGATQKVARLVVQRNNLRPTVRGHCQISR